MQRKSRRSYFLPSIGLDIKPKKLSLRRGAPQRLIFHWEESIYCKDLKYFRTIHLIYTLLKHDFNHKDVIVNK